MLEGPAIVSVSQLNKQIKTYLEQEIGTLYVEGEISNLSKPSSGHLYFTLKDQNAQIRCVFFKNRQASSLVSKTMHDGQQVIASGIVSLYEARGDYQLIVEQLTAAGLGELYQKFAELKNKLTAEGLFLPSRKKALPSIPQTIGIITSPSGAAIQDILSTLARRFPLAKIVIYPSEVQGISAASQLIKALQYANADKRCEVLILARGGGSIEDLWAFNDEQLARCIAVSVIPVVSGIGHETDFTIADFVADYRAETPTAAATIVAPNWVDLLNTVAQSTVRLLTAINRIIQNAYLKINYLTDKILSPQQRIATFWQKLDYLERQLHAGMSQIISTKQYQLNLYTTQLYSKNPKLQIKQSQLLLTHLLQQLTKHGQTKIDNIRQQLYGTLSTLHAVSPLATLDRGYAIATKQQKILTTTKQLVKGDLIKVRLAQGELACKIIEIKEKLI